MNKEENKEFEQNFFFRKFVKDSANFLIFFYILEEFIENFLQIRQKIILIRVVKQPRLNILISILLQKICNLQLKYFINKNIILNRFTQT